MSCVHLDGLLHRLQLPKPSQSVHREECTQCFDNQDAPEGVDVCLTCFNGGCLDPDRHHARTHVLRSGHPFTVNVKRTLRERKNKNRAEDEEPPLKMTKLAIVEEERDQDKYDLAAVVKCWECDPQSGLEIRDSTSNNNNKLNALVDGILTSQSSARQSDVKAWEEEIVPCEHTLTLEHQQPLASSIPASGLAHCTACDLKENLWICLTCGSLGCGRQQFFGAGQSTGGNGHGLAHYEATLHPVSVKLGTITPEGGADVYCYACNDSKLDPNIAAHLRTFGIDVQSLSKTEKSMTELQIEHNLKYDFSLTTSDGKTALEPAFGPGLTGLKNLGNSCYMASVLQAVFSLRAFRDRYYYDDEEQRQRHAETCEVALPAECVQCQMVKLADGLLSGRYSRPPPPPPVRDDGDDPTATTTLRQHYQTGIKPAGFKALIGKGHAEFATMKQQDSEEFFTHLVSVVRRDGRRFGENRERDPTQVFSYAMEQRLQCTECKRVAYRVDRAEVLSVVVPLRERVREEKMDDDNGKQQQQQPQYEEVGLMEECIEGGALGVEALEYACPECGKAVIATKRSKFASLPEVLVVHAKKFQLVNWVPAKLDVPLILPKNDRLEFSESHFGRGVQPGEVEFSSNVTTTTSTTTTTTGSSSSNNNNNRAEFNAAAMAQLQAMGFPEVRCRKALLATATASTSNENADGDAGVVVEAAMEWLFAHMDDPDIDVDSVGGGAGAGGGRGGQEPEGGSVDAIVEMGFTKSQARKALRETGGDVGRAVEWLFSHPDDLGEVEEDAQASSQPQPQVAAATLPGRTDVPARYELLAFVSHKGPSVHSGHYVAHVRKPEGAAEGGRWVLFNDEKVVRASSSSEEGEEEKEKEKGGSSAVEELKKLAYMYFFVRV